MSPSLLDLKEVRTYLRRKVLISVATDEKRVALTFDDGPHPRNTPRLLDLLEKKGIRATFFIVGRNLRRHPEIVARASEQGHEIANHGYHHIPLVFLPEPMIRREIRGTGELIAGTTGRHPTFLRPPLGWFSDRVIGIAEDLGYRPVIGDVYPRDSRKPGSEVILSRILDRIEKGSIVILHDGGQWPGTDRLQTVEAVDRLTDHLGERGFEFDTLSDLTRPLHPAEASSSR